MSRLYISEVKIRELDDDLQLINDTSKQLLHEISQLILGNHNPNYLAMINLALIEFTRSTIVRFQETISISCWIVVFIP